VKNLYQKNSKAQTIILINIQIHTSRSEVAKNKIRTFLITRQLYRKDLVNLKHLQTSLNICIKLLKLGIPKLRELSCILNVCIQSVEAYSKSHAILEIISGSIQVKGLLIVIFVERHLHRVEI
jgi:hypothetical protein